MNNYGEAFTYEAFLRRAFDTPTSQKYYGSVADMKNLMSSELGQSNVQHLGKTDKLLKKVKDNLLKACDKFLKMKLTDDEKMKLTQIRTGIENSLSSSQLLEFIDKGLDVTQRFK